LKYFIYHPVPVLAPNYEQYILSLSKVTKECYSLAELYVKFVYLNLFEWGCKVHETFCGGAQAIEVLEPLV
jgi:hypothetical protein